MARILGLFENKHVETGTDHHEYRRLDHLSDDQLDMLIAYLESRVDPKAIVEGQASVSEVEDGAG
mgnify:CR=1 FL=1